MHIAFIEPHLEIYGGIRRVLEFANRFVERGERVTIYHPTGEPCTWMRCDADTRPLSALREADPDVLIFNDPPDYRHARRARARLKVFYILALYERDKLKRFDPKIYWPRKGRMLTLKRSLQLPFLRVSNATWMQTWLREELGLESELQIGGINRDLFHPVDVPRSKGGFRVLCAGDPRSRKGTDTVHAAVEIVRRRFPDVELDTYHGKGIPQSEMAACYCGADLFVDAQWYAGWNNPVVEAMACGVPVVCTDIGGVADFAFDGETALLVPARDPVALAEAIARMITSPQLRADLAARALAHVARFDWDESTDRFLSMLRRHLPPS